MGASELLRGEFGKLVGSNNNCPPLNAAIVGGGLSGLATLYEIYSRRDEVLEPGQTLNITIFDPHGFDGRGIPYAPPHGKSAEMVDAWKKLTLNVPTYTMLEEPQHDLSFCDWLAEQNSNFALESFAPRYVFGDYLAELAQKIIETIANDPRVNLHIKEEKVETAAQAIGYIVLGTEEERRAFDHVFLASGHIRTMPLDELEGQAGYFRTPYNFAVDEMRERGDAEKNVILFGGESSIIDAFVVMEEMGYDGKYTIITRAAEALETKRSGIGVPLTPGYERFCRTRDYESGRLEIIYGFVHNSEITLSENGNEFVVPATVMHFGEDAQVEFTAANLVNASLWEYKPTITGGHFYSAADAQVHSLETGIPCNSLIAGMQDAKLIHFDPEDKMMRTDSAQLSIIGSPLMVGRNDVGAKAWSALNSWATAIDAVNDFVAKRTMQASGSVIPSAHSTALSPS